MKKGQRILGFSVLFLLVGKLLLASYITGLKTFTVQIACLVFFISLPLNRELRG